MKKKQSTSLVVAAGLKSEDAAARSLDRVGMTTEAAELLNIGLTAESHVEKLARDAMPYVLVVGAAFHLAKAQMEHGQWERTIENATPMALRTVRERMQTVDNALAKLGYELEPRAYETIVFSSKISKRRACAVLESKFAKGLTARLNEIFSGKNIHAIQLELGIRAPKKLLLAAVKPDADPAQTIAHDITEALQNFRCGLAMLQNHVEHLSDKDRAEVGYYCADHLAHMLPSGWKFHVHAHTGKELTIQQVFAEHLGLPEAE